MSSLMRRRENPKPLPTLVPADNGAYVQRGFLQPAVRHAEKEIAAWRPVSLVPVSRARMVSPLEQSRFTQFRAQGTAAIEPRAAAPTRWTVPRQKAHGLPACGVSAAAGLAQCTRQQSILPAVRRGAALRVSLAAGFRRRRMETRGILLPPLGAIAAASRSGCIRQAAAVALDAAPRTMLSQDGVFQIGLHCPPSPGFQASPGIRRPDAISLVHAGDHSCQARPMAARWNPREPLIHFSAPNCTVAMMPSRRAEVRPLANRPAQGEQAPRSASLPFLSQDVPFGFAEEEPQIQ
jgi:hypothetical protein